MLNKPPEQSTTPLCCRLSDSQYSRPAVALLFAELHFFAHLLLPLYEERALDMQVEADHEDSRERRKAHHWYALGQPKGDDGARRRREEEKGEDAEVFAPRESQVKTGRRVLCKEKRRETKT